VPGAGFLAVEAVHGGSVPRAHLSRRALVLTEFLAGRLGAKPRSNGDCNLCDFTVGGESGGRCTR
jgi:hypothetical protein